MISQQIKQNLSEIIAEEYKVFLSAEQAQVEIPSLESFGDYTSNIAMQVVKLLPEEQKQSPLNIAKKIAELLKQRDNSGEYEKIEVAPPGFINITLSMSYLNNFLNNKDLVQKITDRAQQTLIEHTGPNTNKPLHIGHIRNATLGTACLNLLKSVGNNVLSANINNDRGIHIIKSMYGYLMYGQKQQEDIDLKNYKTQLEKWLSDSSAWYTPEEKNLKPDHFVGYYYILGNNDYEDSESKSAESDVINQNDPHMQMQQMLIDWESEDEGIRKLWSTNNNWFYQGMHQTLEEYGIKSPNDSSKFFDKEWYESQIYKEGKNIITEKIGNGIITEFEDGHVEAVLEKYNLPNIVLLRKNKTSLYITQDIELMRKRIKEDHIDKVVILTDSGQNLRFQQLFAVCESLDIAPRTQMLHIGYGSVRLPEGKMSSRKGTVIQADQLLADVKAKAAEKINETREQLGEEEKNTISSEVALAAIKYGMLKYNALSNIVFDLDKNIEFEGDTGPYLQYTHARACSILRKTERMPENVQLQNSTSTTEELTLLKHLEKYSFKVIKAAESISPNYVCEYLFILAQKFNAFYATNPILSEKNTSIRGKRLLITQKTKETMAHGISLLGIHPLEKM